MSRRKRAPSKPGKTAGPRRVDAPLPRAWTIALLALILAFTAFIRIRLLDFPLERDEGEYAYAGQLILQGVPPYSLVYNMKLPGIYAAYALILAVFGQSPAGIHAGLLLVNAAAILLVFGLAKRLFGVYAGIFAAATYAILSVGQPVLGAAAHATHFVILPALAGTLVLVKADEHRRPWPAFASGLLMGTALVMKQHGAVFIAFGLAYVLSTPLRSRARGWEGVPLRASLFALGAVAPIAVTCLLLLRAGVFDTFWFWAVSYAREYASQIQLDQIVPSLQFGLHLAVGPSLPLWVFAAIGLAAVWHARERRAGAIFVTAFLVFSAIGVCPGFFFRPHYFVLILPALAILAGAAAVVLARPLIAGRPSGMAAYGLPALMFAVPFGLTLLREAPAFFTLTPIQICRATYGANPFPESIEIARYIAENSKPDDRIAILGSEPQIYFYSRRRSATGHIYTYALMEQQPYAARMQREMIREIESGRPEYLLFVAAPMSWLTTSKSEKLIFDWYSKYVPEHYDHVGVIDLLGSLGSQYVWGAEAQSYTPRSTRTIYVFRRRSADTGS